MARALGIASRTDISARASVASLSGERIRRRCRLGANRIILAHVMDAEKGITIGCATFLPDPGSTRLARYGLQVDHHCRHISRSRNQIRH